MTGVERVRIDTGRNSLDVLDNVKQLTSEAVDSTHVFTLAQVDEGLLLKMGEKGNDGDPKVGEGAFGDSYVPQVTLL